MKDKIKLIIVAVVIIIFIQTAIFISIAGNKKPTPTSTSIPSSQTVQVTPVPSEVVATQATSTPQPSAEADYSEFFKVKVNRDRGSVINYKLLISPNDELLVQDIAESVFKKCPKNCTIDIYNDERALNLHEAYDQMYMKPETTPEDLKKWEKQNYVYVTDHYIGRIDFDTKMFNDYPLKDSYYKELGGKN